MALERVSVGVRREVDPLRNAQVLRREVFAAEPVASFGSGRAENETGNEDERLQGDQPLGQCVVDMDWIVGSEVTRTISEASQVSLVKSRLVT